MKHGILQAKSIRPYEGDLFGTSGPIKLNGRTYRFEGYKTSIMRYLLDNGTRKIVDGKPPGDKADEYGTSTKRPICVRGGNVGKTASETVVETFQGGALGLIGGGSGPIMEIASTALDVKDALDIANSATGATDKVADVSRPGKIAYGVDHAFGNRIIIDIDCYMRSSAISKFHSKVVDTKGYEVTFSQLAAIVKGMP